MSTSSHNYYAVVWTETNKPGYIRLKDLVWPLRESKIRVGLLADAYWKIKGANRRKPPKRRKVYEVLFDTF